MGWLPKTLLDYLEDGNESPLPSRRYKNKAHNPLTYKCPCGAWVRPGRLVDMRGSGLLSQDWACDGCTTKEKRKAGKRLSTERNNWVRNFARDMKAPKEVLDRIPKK